MTVIGIDPGLDGGIAALDDSGLNVIPMPTASLAKGKREIDEGALRRLLLGMVAYPNGAGATLVCVERVGAMPKQGVVSMFTFGVGWGLVRGILCGLDLPYLLVRPQEWQKVMLAGQPKGSEYAVISRLHPQIDFRASDRCRVPHSGMVDAACIAEYGRRREGQS